MKEEEEEDKEEEVPKLTLVDDCKLTSDSIG